MHRSTTNDNDRAHKLNSEQYGHARQRALALNTITDSNLISITVRYDKYCVCSVANAVVVVVVVVVVVLALPSITMAVY